MNDLKSTDYQLRNQIQTLSSNIKTGDNVNKNQNTRDRISTRQDSNQKGYGDDKVTWTTDLLFGNNWSKKKKDNYNYLYKRMEPDGYNKWMKEHEAARHAKELARLN